MCFQETMAWDGYIKNVIDRCPHDCDSVCILGLNDESPWTSDASPNHLKLAAGEAQVIAKCCKSKDFSNMMSNGVRVGGMKYQFLRVQDDKVVLAKKKDHGAITLNVTKQAVIVSHTKEGGQQGQTNNATQFVADHLESNGY